MNPAQDIVEYLRRSEDELLAFLMRLVSIESPSHEPKHVQLAMDFFRGELEADGFRARQFPGGESAGHLLARPHPRRRHRPLQLLIGHIDTVWPLGTLESMPVRVEEGRLRGPGVYDMKAGLTQILFALRAVRELRLEPEVTPIVFINSDEEIGSPESRRSIRRLARIANRVYVLEPSLGSEGALKTGRKGVGRFKIVVEGKAAHAGLDPHAGASAILELSHQIQSLFGLNDPDRGVSVNVGTIDGGLRPNVIAPISSAVVDVRVPTAEAASRIEQAILGLSPVGEGTKVRVEGSIGRPPMTPSPEGRALWEVARGLGLELGIELEEGFAGGGSDGNTTNLYAPTLDGLGGVGDGAHAAHEFVRVDRLVERSALLAMLILSPPISLDKGTTPCPA